MGLSAVPTFLLIPLLSRGVERVCRVRSHTPTSSLLLPWLVCSSSVIVCNPQSSPSGAYFNFFIFLLSPGSPVSRLPCSPGTVSLLLFLATMTSALVFFSSHDISSCSIAFNKASISSFSCCSLFLAVSSSSSSKTSLGMWHLLNSEREFSILEAPPLLLILTASFTCLFRADLW